MFKVIKRFRWLAYVILPFILSTVSLGEVAVTNYEIGNYRGAPLNSSKATTNNSQDQTSLEGKLREALELLDQPNPDPGKIGKLTREIRELDGRILADFAATESDLRGKNVSATILKRHQDFVTQYRENMETLMEGLKTYDPGFLGLNLLFSQAGNNKVDTAKENKLADLKKKLREKWIPQEFNPFKDGKFPKKNADFHPREPQLTPSITPAYEYPFKPQSTAAASSSASASFSATDEGVGTPVFGVNDYNSTTADLQETVEVQLTPEIKELARHLDYNPVKIYEYVHNNIDYAPYYGSVKGAQETLWQKAGNDFDQASLLIALYRASGIPCRYVYGVVEIPVDKAKNWIGIEDQQTALNTFCTNGIPSKGIIIGDKLTYLQKEHVWVEAYVSVNHYRGSAGDESGKGWLAIDPSFKQHTVTAGIDLKSVIPFDEQSFFTQLKDSATIGDNGASISDLDHNLIKQKMGEYQQAIQNYLNQNYPNFKLEDVLGNQKIVTEELSILPLSLPYQVISINKELNSLDNSYRQMISFKIVDPNDFFAEEQCTYTSSIPLLGNKRISLGYIAASQQDANFLASYLPKPHTDGSPIKPEELPTKLPSYLVKVKPQLMIDGTVVATGYPVTLGTEQKFYMDFSYPSYVGASMNHIENQIVAGALHVITLNTGQVTNEKINQKLVNIKADKAKLIAENYNQVQPENLFGGLLNVFGLTYFYELDSFNKIYERVSKVKVLRMVSEAITTMNLNVGYMFGMPRTVTQGGLSIDVDRDFYSVMSINGDRSKVKEFFLNTGPIASYLEGSIFQQIFGGEAVSAIHILKAANEQGITIYNIDKTNMDSILPKLEYSNTKKQMLANLLNSGKELTIPAKSLSIGQWNGTGYIARDPNNGTGAYMIDGGLAGGWSDMTQALRVYLITMFLCILVGAILAIAGIFVVGAIGILMLMALPFFAMLPEQTQNLILGVAGLALCFASGAFVYVGIILALAAVAVFLCDAIKEWISILSATNFDLIKNKYIVAFV